MSSVFFILWSTAVPAIAVQVDTLIWNSVHIIINIALIIPLIQQIMPIKFSPIEEDIYERNFKGFLTRRQYGVMIKQFEKVSLVEDTHICKFNTEFDYMYYVVKIEPGYKIAITSSDPKYKVKDIAEGSWIGTAEYSILERNLNKKKKLKKMTGVNKGFEVKWGINVYLQKKAEGPGEVPYPNQPWNTRDESIKKQPEQPIQSEQARHAEEEVPRNEAQQREDAVAIGGNNEENREPMSDIKGALIYKISIQVKLSK